MMVPTSKDMTTSQKWPQMEAGKGGALNVTFRSRVYAETSLVGYSIHRYACMRRRVANAALPASSKGVDIERESGAGASRQRSVVPEEPWRRIRLPETRPSTWVH